MKEQAIGIAKGFGTIFLYFILTLIASFLLKDYYYSPNKVIATLSQLGTYLILTLGISLVYYKRLINDFKNFKKEYVNIAVRNWAIGLCIMIISNIILNMIIKDIPTNESLNRTMLSSYPISNIIYMALLGPLAEEITFRASFKDGFKKWYTFALFTSLLFGLAHIAEASLLELLFIIPYGALGFFFAKSFYETDNIYTSLLAHVSHNTMCIILLFLM